MSEERDAGLQDAGLDGSSPGGPLGGPSLGTAPPGAATTVVVDPGQLPHGPPVLEVRGPLSEGRVAAVLERAGAGRPGEATAGRRWEHRLERLGSDHHLLHVAGAADADAFPAGLVADLLTSPDRPGVPLAPAQLDLLRDQEGRSRTHPVVLVDVTEPLAPAQVARALRALVRAHPLLGTRVGAPPSGTTSSATSSSGTTPSATSSSGTSSSGTSSSGPDDTGTDPAPATPDGTLCGVADVGRAREAAAVADVARGLDPSAGHPLGAVLLRKRRRLAVVVHELVADARSAGVLRADLETLLTAGEEDLVAEEDVRYADWVASLPALAADPTATDRWRTVAEDRAAATAFRSRFPLPDHAPTRHPGFLLGKAATTRLTGVLAGRLGLTPAQLLTGAVGLALARWRGTGYASFDVHTDGRQDSPALARTVGPLAETEPVVLMAAAGHDGDAADAADAVERIARRLATVGSGSYGACREYAADPALRLVLREPVPVLARFVPDAAGSPGPRPVVPYALDLTARTASGGRLRLGLEWLPAPRDGITAESADRLLAVLRDVLEELARGADGAPVVTACDTPRLTVAASPLQRELLADADAHPGTGRQIEQLSWTWHGPLDTGRFTAAWQSVFDQESVLRSSFAAGPDPRVVVHDRVVSEVVRLSYAKASWSDVLVGDRRRGLDPRSPGPLRVTLFDGPRHIGPDGAPVAAPATRVLLTYHHALLDTWSVRLLLEEFYRAYVAGGTLPGGDRRPDQRDHAHWLAGQDLTAARDFWLRAVPPRSAEALAVVTPPGPPAPPGTGRAVLRLTAAEATRLRVWAARWGATESGALQVAWALLLYRAAGAAGPTPVRFSVAVSGRGIPLDGVERLPGALRNPLPVSVEVDPGATVPDLLVRLRDRALDLAAYEWVSAGQIRSWTAPDDDTDRQAARPPRAYDTLLVFETRLRPHEGLEPSLAALGVRVESPERTGAPTSFPVTFVSHYDEGGGLVLAVEHDRARLPDATGLLAHCARLLRELPHRADDVTTVAGFLDAVPRATRPDTAFATLRPGTGGVVCLAPSPDAPPSWYSRVARFYPGPDALILLHPAPDGVRAWYEALRPVVTEGRLSALGAFSGGGAGAYELARLAAGDGVRPPAVVLAGGNGSDDSVREFARFLDLAAARHTDEP
ncbi:condensation domain-containing protein [Streptomyces sp. NPDC002640]